VSWLLDDRYRRIGVVEEVLGHGLLSAESGCSRDRDGTPWFDPVQTFIAAPAEGRGGREADIRAGLLPTGSVTASVQAAENSQTWGSWKTRSPIDDSGLGAEARSVRRDVAFVLMAADVTLEDQSHLGVERH
jgi:hypothetical protein